MKKPYKIVSGASTPNSRELADWLAKDGQLLIPLVELLEKGERAIDEVIDVMGRATIEAVLQMSVAQVAGPKEQGRRDADRELYWHGVQAGRVALKERQLQVDKPRLRKKRPRADGRLVVRHVTIFGHGHGFQRAIIDESQHRKPERLIMAMFSLLRRIYCAVRSAKQRAEFSVPLSSIGLRERQFIPCTSGTRH